MKMMKQTLAVLCVLVLTLAGCKQTPAGNYEASSEVTNYVKLEIKDSGDIILELKPEVAPLTVKNFQDLVAKGFYDGLIFHRIVPGFVLQGGDPQGNGMGGPGYTIKGEFSANGVDNPLLHTKGVLSMARSQDYDSAGSQFFIMLEDAPHLDNAYAAFGEVIEGMEVAEKIEDDYVANKLTEYPSITKASFVKPK